jgi:hypothetical protein
MTDTQASSGGRSLSRANITAETWDVTVPFHRTDGTPPLFAGFRINWFNGDDKETGTTFDMSAGAGMGSKYLTLMVAVPGHDIVYEYVDMAAVLEQRVTAIIAEVTASGRRRAHQARRCGDQGLRMDRNQTPRENARGCVIGRAQATE